MLLHSDSFATASTGDSGTKWDFSTTSFAPTVTEGQGRDGGRAVEADTGARGYANAMSKTFADLQGLSSALFLSQSCYFPVGASATYQPFMGAFTTPSSAASAALTSKSGIFLSYASSTQTIRLERVINGTRTTLATGAAVLPTTWMRVELKIDITNDSVVVNIDGVEYLNNTADQVTLAAGLKQGWFGNIVTRIDDTLIYNSVDVGDAFDGFLGDVIIDCLFPNAAGTYSNFSLSTGSAANYTYVDEQTPSLVDYVFSSTVNHKDSYNYGVLPSTPTTIHGVIVNSIVLPINGTTRPFVSALAILSATEVESTSTKVPQASTSALMQALYATKPGGGAWTKTDIDAAEFGLKLTAN